MAIVVIYNFGKCCFPGYLKSGRLIIVARASTNFAFVYGKGSVVGSVYLVKLVRINSVHRQVSGLGSNCLRDNNTIEAESIRIIGLQ